MDPLAVGLVQVLVCFLMCPGINKVSDPFWVRYNFWDLWRPLDEDEQILCTLCEEPAAASILQTVQSQFTSESSSSSSSSSFWMWMSSETLEAKPASSSLQSQLESQWLRLKCLTRTGLILRRLNPTHNPENPWNILENTRSQSLWLFVSTDQELANKANKANS